MRDEEKAPVAELERDRAVPNAPATASTAVDEHPAVEYLTEPTGLRVWIAGHWSQFASLLIAAALWEVTGRLASPLVFAPLSETIVALWDYSVSGALWSDMRVSGAEVGLGLFFGSLIGWTGAVVASVSKTFRLITDPWVSALYTTPYVALTPVFIVWLGLGIASKVALVIFATFIPTWLTTYTAIVTTDKQLKEVARAFDANRLQEFRYVVLPWIVPGLMTGFRLSLSRGIIAMVVGELIGGSEGIGVMIDRASRSFDTPKLLAGILVLIIMALALIGLVRYLQRKLVPWWDTQGGSL